MGRTIIADLHNHSTASDGEFSPTELVAKVFLIIDPFHQSLGNLGMNKLLLLIKNLKHLVFQEQDDL